MILEEKRLKGTPKDLALKIDDLNLHRDIVYIDEPEWFIPGKMGMELPNDANPVDISIVAVNNQIFAKARQLPDHKTLLILEVTDDEWVYIKPSWQILLNELEKEGWFATDTPISEQYQLPEKPTPISPQYELPKKPTQKSDISVWIEYYHQRKECRKNNPQIPKYTLKDMAKDSSCSYDNIRKKHSGCPTCKKHKSAQK